MLPPFCLDRITEAQRNRMPVGRTHGAEYGFVAWPLTADSSPLHYPNGKETDLNTLFSLLRHCTKLLLYLTRTLIRLVTINDKEVKAKKKKKSWKKHSVYL